MESRRVRIPRGQVVVRETRQQYSIIVPVEGPREVKTHRGYVLAMGPPAQVSGHDVPHGFAVGDEVIFHWEKSEKAFTRAWIDGEDACWMMQHEIDGVIETRGEGNPS